MYPLPFKIRITALSLEAAEVDWILALVLLLVCWAAIVNSFLFDDGKLEIPHPGTGTDPHCVSFWSVSDSIVFVREFY